MSSEREHIFFIVKKAHQKTVDAFSGEHLVIGKLTPEKDLLLEIKSPVPQTAEQLRQLIEKTEHQWRNEGE